MRHFAQLTKTSRALLLSSLIAFVPLASAGPAAAAAPSAGRAALQPCQFSVGLGDAIQHIDAQCGTITVPEDYAHPDGRTLTIHFDVLPALSTTANGLPIFHLEGGPGGSAITNFGEAWFGSYRALRQNHPVVLIDQRGIGQSASLQCTEITDQALTDLAALGSDGDNNQRDVQRLHDCLTRLSRTTDPQFYTSNALADDTDAVRAALGYDQIDLFGNSYGTSLGQIYLKRHGDHVAALVLDSVTGPWNHWTLDGANNSQAALDHLLALCQADTQCNAAYPDLPGQLQTALDQLTKKPVQVTALSLLTAAPHPVGMTADRLRSALFELLYNEANATIIPSAISAAATGTYTIPAGILIAEAEQAPTAVSLGLYESVLCSEIVPFYTPALIAQYKSAPDNIFTTIDTVDSAVASCNAWHSATLSTADVAPVQSDRPVLILSGGLDPITPVSFGQETHARLNHSTLVIFPYQGHGILPGSACAQQLTAAFLNNPGQPLDTHCAAADLPPLFVGAYQPSISPYNDPAATFTGSAPQGWSAEQDGPLTFFRSPDSTQYAAEGVLKNTTMAAAQQIVVDAITRRYGTVDVQAAQTINMIIVSLTAVTHSLMRADYAYVGAILLETQGTDTKVVWQAAPANWLQASSAVISPKLLLAMNPR